MGYQVKFFLTDDFVFTKKNFVNEHINHYRQGYLQSVTLLMKFGADPSLKDGEGCSCLHLAAQFGHTAIVAYLVAKGLSPNLQDKYGMTPLMWSSYKVSR